MISTVAGTSTESQFRHVLARHWSCRQELLPRAIHNLRTRREYLGHFLYEQLQLNGTKFTEPCFKSLNQIRRHKIRRLWYHSIICISTRRLNRGLALRGRIRVPPTYRLLSLRGYDFLYVHGVYGAVSIDTFILQSFDEPFGRSVQIQISVSSFSLKFIGALLFTWVEPWTRQSRFRF